MPSQNMSLKFDVRKIAQEHMTIRVQLKNLWWFKIGLFFIKVGCWLTGAQFVDEFPMSLIQPSDSYTQCDCTGQATGYHSQDCALLPKYEGK